MQCQADIRVALHFTFEVKDTSVCIIATPYVRYRQNSPVVDETVLQWSQTSRATILELT